MRKRVSFIVGAILAATLALAGVDAAATPNVGQHIHFEVSNHPVDGFPIPRSVYTFHVNIKRHDFPAPIQYVRLDDEKGTIRAKITFIPALPPCDDCNYSFDWSINFSSWSPGRHELRWHVDSQDADPNTSGTQRQYTTSRNQVCIAACSPNPGGRAANWHGGGSWYTGPEYVVPLMLSPDTDVRPGGQIVIRSQYSSAAACAYVNPDFHNLSHGLLLGCGSKGTGTKTLPIPDTTSVGDKIVIVANQGQEAGVWEGRLGDGTPQETAFYATQSWWAKSGLVIP